MTKILSVDNINLLLDSLEAYDKHLTSRVNRLIALGTFLDRNREKVEVVGDQTVDEAIEQMRSDIPAVGLEMHERICLLRAALVKLRRKGLAGEKSELLSAATAALLEKLPDFTDEGNENPQET